MLFSSISSQLGVSYAAATSGAIATAFGLNRMVRVSKNIVLSKRYYANLTVVSPNCNFPYKCLMPTCNGIGVIG